MECQCELLGTLLGAGEGQRQKPPQERSTPWLVPCEHGQHAAVGVEGSILSCERQNATSAAQLSSEVPWPLWPWSGEKEVLPSPAQPVFYFCGK